MADSNDPSSRRAFLRLGTLTGAGICLGGSGALAGEAARPRVASPPKLKVTGLETHVLKTGHIILEVFTNEGITGLGECSPTAGGAVVASLIDRTIRSRVVGQNPFDVEKIWHSAFHGRDRTESAELHLEAFAGVDIALWDIMGKALGVPCYVVMGGKFRSRVPLCASASRRHGGAREMAKRLESWVERGLGVKICLNDDRESGRPADDTLDLVREIRSALGTDVPLSVNVNHAYSVHRAVQVGRGLERLDCALFEAPLAARDYDDHARLSIALDIPVGAGQREQTRWQHKDLVLRGRVDRIQPHVLRCGGLTELRKIGTLASVLDRPIQCHDSQPTIATAAYYHFWVSEPMCLEAQGYPADEHPLRDRYPLLTEPLTIEDGCLTLPDRPGLGIDIDRRVLKRLAG